MILEPYCLRVCTWVYHGSGQYPSRRHDDYFRHCLRAYRSYFTTGVTSIFWKALIRGEKSWPAIKQALRDNVDIALTLFRKDSWAA